MKRTKVFERLQCTAAGQSLVETAIFLPIIFFLLAGALEVSNMLVTQNRVQTAARAGTGFGATNFNTSIPITDTFKAMSLVAANNVTETLDLAEVRWDIYTVKATFNDTGDDFAEWQWQRPYGVEQVLPESEWLANEPQIQDDIRAALTDGDAAGLEIVATVTYHNRQSFLGLGFFNPGLTRIRGLTVMRVSETTGQYDGCDLFPITLRVDNLSLYPENYSGSMEPGGEMYDPTIYEGGNTHIIPDHDYNDDPYDHSGFPLAEGGHPLIPGVEPRRGDIFEAREVEGPGGFGWLSWDGDTSSQALRDSLTPPGNLSLEVPAPPGMINYVNPDDPNDHIPSIGDWIQGSTGNMNNVVDLLDDHINSQRQIQILVFDDHRGTGSNHDFHILGFVQVYLRGRHTVNNDKRILVEFIRWAEPCFAPNPNP